MFFLGAPQQSALTCCYSFLIFMHKQIQLRILQLCIKSIK